MDKEVLSLVLQEMQKAFGNVPDNRNEILVDLIKTFLQEKVYDGISLQDICAHFNLSKSSVCDAFHKETGRGIIEYYTDLKIQEAKILIQKGELNLTQIAEKLRYTSIHQFSRSFKNRTGMSPSAYRKSLG